MSYRDKYITNLLLAIFVLTIYFTTKINVNIFISKFNYSYTSKENMMFIDGKLVPRISFKKQKYLNLIEINSNNDLDIFVSDKRWTTDSLYIISLLEPSDKKYIEWKLRRENGGFVPYAIYVNSKWERTLNDRLKLYCKLLVWSYIRNIYDEAVAQEKIHNIPATITIAQGILESNTGLSKLAMGPLLDINGNEVNPNNHFGIKCPGYNVYKNGKAIKYVRTESNCNCVNRTDDTQFDLFKVYDSFDGSLNDHSLLLKKERYKQLFNYRISDYKNWANGLQKAGYATDTKYASKLINIIEKMNLNNLNK